MNIEQASKFCEDHDDDYMSENLSRIDRLIEGLKIIRKYSPDSDIAASHDLICAGSIDCESDYSEEDVLKLRRIGWHIEEDYECWGRFT